MRLLFFLIILGVEPLNLGSFSISNKNWRTGNYVLNKLTGRSTRNDTTPVKIGDIKRRKDKRKEKKVKKKKEKKEKPKKIKGDKNKKGLGETFFITTFYKSIFYSWLFLG